jgi:ligand-binding sensor domain-containing protein
MRKWQPYFPNAFPRCLLRPSRHSIFSRFPVYFIFLRLPAYFLLLFTSLTTLSSSAQLLPIRNYTIREGLNANSIGALLRDSRGVLWVGTYNGVNWYDGARFLQPEMHTRSGQIYVTNFREDRSGNVWVTSWYSGLYKYNNGRFTNYLIDTLHIESQSNNTFDVLELDSAHFLIATDRNVWLFTGPSPNPAWSFSLFDSANTDLNRQINSLAMTSRQDILIGYDKGVAWYRRQTKGWVYAGMLWQDAGVSNIAIQGDQCWLATGKGLYYFPHLPDHPPSSQTTPSALPSPLAVYPGAQVDHVFIDNDNNIWFTTGDGARRLSGDPLHPRIQAYTSRNGLPSDIITAVLADEEGITWLGSEDGLSRLNKEYYRFYPLREKEIPPVTGHGPPETNRPPDGPNATIISLNTDRNGHLLMGSYNGLFGMQEQQASEITSIGREKIGFVFSLLKDSMQNLWASTDGGILRITGSQLIRQSPIVTFCSSLARDGSLWFGCRDGRVLHGGAGGIREVPNTIPLDERINAIYSDPNGFIWVGYALTGLKKFRITAGRLELVKEYTGRNGYPNMRIRCLGDDGHGHLLAGTRTNGLYIFDIGPSSPGTSTTGAHPPAPSPGAPASSDSPFLHLTTLGGLSGNWIKAAAANNQGVYLATNNGLDFLDLSDRDSPRIRSIPFHNDQVPKELNAICLQSDTIWLGTAKGLLQYMPRRQEKNEMPPPAYLMKVTINGRTDSSFPPFTHEASLPALSYRQNSIAFDFAGLSFRDEENVRYRYQMEGLDKDWSPVTDRRYVNYSNLPPGGYRFRVIAANNDDVWSPAPATLSFHIAAPFWMTGWFIALCSIFLAALLYVFYRYRLQQALQIERLRAKISTDLHDDIGSTLSSISIMSDMILQENKGGPPDTMALEIKENSLSLMDKMDDIVWSINPRNDALEDVMVRIQRFAAPLFEAKGIDYEILISNNIRRLRLPMENRRNVYLIMKEAVINLVKYAEARKVTIKAASVDHTLHVEINDDGKGFAFPDNNSGNGIANMRSRASLMKATLRLHSTPGEGTAVILSLKIK